MDTFVVLPCRAGDQGWKDRSHPPRMTKKGGMLFFATHCLVGGYVKPKASRGISEENMHGSLPNKNRSRSAEGELVCLLSLTWLFHYSHQFGNSCSDVGTTRIAPLLSSGFFQPSKRGWVCSMGNADLPKQGNRRATCIILSTPLTQANSKE